MGVTNARVQQAKVVVDLGDRAHRRPRVATGPLLIDADGRAQTLDVVDVRLLHQSQELPRVGAQRLDVATLTLGIQGVEGERRLAASRQPGEHDQLVAGKDEIEALEVVLAGAVDDDGVVRHAG